VKGAADGPLPIIKGDKETSTRLGEMGAEDAQVAQFPSVKLFEKGGKKRIRQEIEKRRQVSNS